MPTSSAASSAADRGRVAGRIERRIADLGLELPEPVRAPAGVALPFPWVRRSGARAFVSGHGPQNPDGTLAPPFGKVGAEVRRRGVRAPLVALSALGSLKRELGDLDRVEAWLRVLDGTPRRVHRRATVVKASALILELRPRGRGPRPLGDRRGRAALRHRSRWGPRPFRCPGSRPRSIRPSSSTFRTSNSSSPSGSSRNAWTISLPIGGLVERSDSARTLAWSCAPSRSRAAPSRDLAPALPATQTTPRSAPSPPPACLSPPAGGPWRSPRARRRAGPASSRVSSDPTAMRMRR